MKPRKTKTVLETHTYSLGKKISYVINFKNQKEVSRSLKYSGGKHLGYDLMPVYDPDFSSLEKKNPFYTNEGWADFTNEGWADFNVGLLPDNPESLDLAKIVFAQFSTHLLFDINLDPIPVLVLGNYIDAGISSRNYDLKALHAHFSSHPQVKKIGEIELIPYYSNGSGLEKFFEVEVLPTVEQMKVLGIHPRCVFYQPWLKHPDFLGMKQFRLPEIKD
jgi:hypothetical protein